MSQLICYAAPALSSLKSFMITWCTVMKNKHFAESHLGCLPRKLVLSNMLKSNVLGKKKILRVIHYLTYPSMTDRSNFAEHTLTFFFNSTTFSLETDGSLHRWFFFLPFISCSWCNCSWNSEASIFNCFNCFVHIFPFKK